MIQIEKKHLNIILDILRKYQYHFYVFGSRVKNRAKKFSDLDLCYKDSIPDSIIIELEEKFEESDLPFKIDLLDWQRCTKDFQELISKDLERIQ